MFLKKFFLRFLSEVLPAYLVVVSETSNYYRPDIFHGDISRSIPSVLPCIPTKKYYVILFSTPFGISLINTSGILDRKSVV